MGVSGLSEPHQKFPLSQEKPGQPLTLFDSQWTGVPSHGQAANWTGPGVRLCHVSDSVCWVTIEGQRVGDMHQGSQ